jgi:hypothetical protein
MKIAIELLRDLSKFGILGKVHEYLKIFYKYRKE